MINLFKQLSEEDRNKTYSYICSYAGMESDSINPAVNLEYILRFWNESKQDLYKLLGNEFMISRDINFTASPDELEDEYIDRISGYAAPGRLYREWYYNQIRILKWNRIITADEWVDLNDLIDCEALCANVYTGKKTIVLRNGNKSFALSNGMKLGKFFNKFTKLMDGDMDEFEKFRIAHSMLLNQKTMKGTLYLSIHPLDYMTMSDNNCDWESCMSWQQNGDYRQGTVEMMNSPCVVMAYLRAKDDMDLWYDCKDKGKWNNKRWRQLFIVRPEILLAIKGYPYQNDNLSAICLNWLKELASKNLGWNSYTQYLNRVKNNQSNFIGEIDRKIELNIYSNYMYNDIYSEHDAYIATNLPIRTGGFSKIEFNYSGKAECMNCGESIEYGDLGESSFLICNNCCDYKRCDSCGDLFESDGLYEVDGEYYCSCCYDYYVENCSICGEPHHSNNLTDILLSNGVDSPESRGVCVCENCMADEDVKAKYFTAPFKEYTKMLWSSYPYIEFDQLTERGKELFGIENEEYEEMLQNKVELIRKQFAS